MSGEFEARILIECVEMALAHGVKHYEVRTRRPLTTVQEVLECLVHDNEVIIDGDIIGAAQSPADALWYWTEASQAIEFNRDPVYWTLRHTVRMKHIELTAGL